VYDKGPLYKLYIMSFCTHTLASTHEDFDTRTREKLRNVRHNTPRKIIADFLYHSRLVPRNRKNAHIRACVANAETTGISGASRGNMHVARRSPLKTNLSSFQDAMQMSGDERIYSNFNAPLDQACKLNIDKFFLIENNNLHANRSR
jgi:hypothetical protein